MHEVRTKGYRIQRDASGYRLHRWYDLGTGEIQYPASLYRSRKAADAAGRRWKATR